MKKYHVGVEADCPKINQKVALRVKTHDPEINRKNFADTKGSIIEIDGCSEALKCGADTGLKNYYSVFAPSDCVFSIELGK